MLKTLISGLAAAGLVAGSAAAAFPDHPVTIIVPFGAGGGTDSDARGFQPHFAAALGGATVIVKNTDGAAGTIGAAEAAKAKPDGYTLGFLPIGPAVIQPHLRQLPYTSESFIPICNINSNPVVLMAAKDSPIGSLEDMKKTLTAEPNKYVYGSSGPGTVPHLAMAAAEMALQVKMKHVPHKGTADAMKSLAGGVIHFFADVPVVISRFETKPIAVFNDTRIPGLDSVPTMKEKGYDLSFSVWRGLFAPKGTPEPVVAALETACRKAAESPGFKEFSAKVNNDVNYMDRKAFAAFVASEVKKNGDILKSVGLTK